MAEASVLVIEDDPDLRRLLRQGLAREGFSVRTVANGRDGVKAGTDDRPALLVIDVGLPDADGRDVCQALRARGVEAPVLFLTARDAVVDRVAGFAAGGDDYLTKPFAFVELIARLRALLRRSGIDATSVVGDLRLDPVSHSVGSGSRVASLTPIEFRLLGALAASPGAVLRRRDLRAAGWPDGAIVHDNTLDVYIGRLRRKLAAIPSGSTIATIHGVGYSLR